ncbi:NAD(P)/FAD-dependent oxidoreductase [Bacillus albus]|uniref:flavin-containing monooxygenase n=1 Tax=Bacillus cereus group TaxID=86661 RepID=UPI0022DF2688|nr:MULTISPECIES: NAD(P)/FAD-dependent oxidoreductase [Bacillus cereus group]MDA2026548.1 NAD(P)/FAD-dependent oxidoreductase [Bacillus cereus group sp. Bcc03]MDA2218472.1 NAD(P)/FAD-dependent oxidoreductase [Bacillus cereus group sp. Bc228]MDA2229837.1 NAD(P)/FAD-dependent oxidoreductase [Bacillus cereus group sp. Bc227]MDA2262488.1 NAD(P)/FAD-dependent oxidoreductase [Bacillus cereus group sp. Bc200]MDA2323816.1 NAD(P)/FAD-dependent oxidoreductase [Bacillus cereus group sp. Bc177]
MKEILDSIVIGGGQAGLASGYHLQKKGFNFLILEASERIAGSWPYYYDSLKLFSPARFSSLPGMQFPGHPDDYPTRNEVIDYLQNYVESFQLPVMLNQRVESVEKEDGIFKIKTAPGETFQTRTIINATGSFHSPFNPIIKDQEKFKGNIIHSAMYRSPNHYINQRVVVAGRRNSAVQIALELADVSRVSLAVRKPVQLMKQKVWGKDLHFWLKVLGIDTFPFWRFGKTAPSSGGVIDLGDYKERLARGNPDQRSMFTSFYTDGVVWLDGKKEPIDTVIFATGYQPNLSYFNAIGALDSEGRPMQIAGVSTEVQGVYYVGLEGQRSFSSATLRGVGSDAKFVVRKLISYLKIWGE